MDSRSKKLEKGKKRHEFQARSRSENGLRQDVNSLSMRSINIENCMGHSIGISNSYYRVTEDELLEDYLKAVPFLTIGEEKILQLPTRGTKERNQDEITAFRED